MTGDTPASRPQPTSSDASRVRDRLAPVREAIRSRLAVDTRSLAALRIALGMIILLDLAQRAGSIERFYTDAGVYPLAAYEATYTQYNGLSIHALSGDLWFQQLLFVVAALFAIALVVGYRTRLVAVVSLVLLISLHARNPAVLNGADRLLRVLLLVALVTPLGERWSVDALRRGSARTTVVDVSTAAVLLQPLVVLSQNAVLKHRGDTWYAGEALEVAFANDAMTVHLGNHLAAYPALLEALNWAWVTLLSGSVALLLLTDGRSRAFFALVYVVAFLGMVPTLAVGIFPFVLAASVLPFLTAPFWDAVGDRVPSGWTERLRPRRSHLGPLGRPPVGRRLLGALRRSGRDAIATFVVDYGRSLRTVAGVMLLCWMLLFGAVHATSYDVPAEVDVSVGDEQRWGLYAPNPSESYNWYVVGAELANGSTVDALTGGEITTDRPPDAARAYGTFRDRKFMESVSSSGRSDTDDTIAVGYADWACDRAASTHAETVERVTVRQFEQPSPIDGTYEDPYRWTVVERTC